MSNLTFWLLVIGVPLVCVATVLVLSRVESFLSRHPTVTCVFAFSVAACFVGSALLDFFSNPPSIVLSVILGAAGVAQAIHASFRFRAQKISGGAS